MPFSTTRVAVNESLYTITTKFPLSLEVLGLYQFGNPPSEGETETAYYLII
jgi:hypothetical protein